MADRLPACRLVPGAAEFLACSGVRHYLASSAPIHEVHLHLERHDISRAFAGVFGHPHRKERVLVAAQRSNPGATVVFFGDAPADHHAARAARVRFVAVNPSEGLLALVDGSVPDFRDQDAVWRLVRSG